MPRASRRGSPGIWAATLSCHGGFAGPGFWNKRSKDGLEKAISYFQQAVEKDSHFALAYALMADCYYLQVYYRYNPAPETIGNAEVAAERALLLDDSVAEGHVAMAMVHSLQKNGRLCMESQSAISA